MKATSLKLSHNAHVISLRFDLEVKVHMGQGQKSCGSRSTKGSKQRQVGSRQRQVAWFPNRRRYTRYACYIYIVLLYSFFLTYDYILLWFSFLETHCCNTWPLNLGVSVEFWHPWKSWKDPWIILEFCLGNFVVTLWILQWVLYTSPFASWRK